MDKLQLRQFYKNIRSSISSEEKLDSENRILTILINSDLFKVSEMILAYVSFKDEVDTLGIISYCLNNNKRVAVPFCGENNIMDFYEITDISELLPGKYGIPSVDIYGKNPVSLSDRTICLVPALCFDKSGNRIGYGGGYYDRYLARTDVISVGLCFERNLSLSYIPSEKNDIPVNFIIDENKIFKTKNRGGLECE